MEIPDEVRQRVDAAADETEEQVDADAVRQALAEREAGTNEWVPFVQRADGSE